MRAINYLGPQGPLSRSIDGYEHRPSQLAMAARVEDTIREGGVSVIEAGTGTGKTLAYLVPALLSGRRVVISTATKTLQDQIMEKDIPLLRKHLDFPVDVACMKGISNYVCRRRFEEYRHRARGRILPPRELSIIDGWVSRTKTGDRAELSDLADDDPVWGEVLSSSETRLGAKCPHYDACFVTAMREEASRAQVVVVNHHLFFADLAMRGSYQAAQVMPDYDVVIFDEAHQIEDVVTQFFGVSLSTSRIERLCRDAERAFRKLELFNEGSRFSSGVLHRSSDFLSTIEPPRYGAASMGRQHLPPKSLEGEGQQALLALDTALEGLHAFCQRMSRENQYDPHYQDEQLAQVARRAARARDDLAIIGDGDRDGRVVWLEKRGRSVSVGSSPVDVSSILRDEVFYRVNSVVLTSATLSTAKSFSFIKQRLGIDFEVEEEILESPFDYREQAALYVASDLPDPRSNAYLDGAEAEVRDLVNLTKGGAFVLCTSNRVMRELHRRLEGELPYEVMLQGQAPKAKLLQDFRESGNAVLFATASFWEGVDVPGEALRLVIIDKLPFDVPSDPLVAARCDRLKEEGQQPFMKYLVPSAALNLKQGFGRLIRSRRDRGIVALLDSRLVTKSYGKVFLRSLPDATRCDDLPALREFWEKI